MTTTQKHSIIVHPDGSFTSNVTCVGAETAKPKAMKKRTISMQQFAEMVKELAVSIGQQYYCVRCNMSHHLDLDKEPKFTFSCYIHAATWITGISPLDALQKLKDYISPPVSDIQDVVIDMKGLPL